MSTPAPEFYVSNVTRAPGKTTYVVVTDSTWIRNSKLVMGYVTETSPSAPRVYLDASANPVTAQPATSQLDAAVDSYKAWAAKH